MEPFTWSSNLNLDAYTKICARYNAILAEPRTKAENDFLHNMTTRHNFEQQHFDDPILLGMNDKDVEGLWRWNSDGSLVKRRHWVTYMYGHKSNSIQYVKTGGRKENCAMMVKNSATSVIKQSDTAGWDDISCTDSAFFRSKRVALVCQKPERKYK